MLEHAQRKGILAHFVLGETEDGNEKWLGGKDTLHKFRKLYYRELSARFGHLLAIKWNITEENDFSADLLLQFSAYIDAVDPYDHPIAFHNFPGDYAEYELLVGEPNFTATSIQYGADQADARSKHGEIIPQQPATSGLSTWTNKPQGLKPVMRMIYANEPSTMFISAVATSNGILDITLCR